MIDLSIEQIINGMKASGCKIPERLTAESLCAVLDQPSSTAIKMARMRDLPLNGPTGTIVTRFYHPWPGGEIAGSGRPCRPSRLCERHPWIRQLRRLSSPADQAVAITAIALRRGLAMATLADAEKGDKGWN